MQKACVCWSSGKDSAMCLYHALQAGLYDIQCLFSALSSGRIAMHETGEPLLARQAQAMGIPLWAFRFAPDWNAREYAHAMETSLGRLREKGISVMLSGDIHLEALRDKRIAACKSSGLKANFPIWGRNPEDLLLEFMRLGFRAVITSIDRNVLDDSFLGRMLDEDFLRDYPKHADLCGENGEYHSFVFDGPIFSRPVRYEIAGKLFREYAGEDGKEPGRFGYLQLR